MAKAPRITYRVDWMLEDGKGWQLYQTNLSRARAERLAYQVRWVLGPRWYPYNPQTRVVMEY